MTSFLEKLKKGMDGQIVSAPLKNQDDRKAKNPSSLKPKKIKEKTEKEKTEKPKEETIELKKGSILKSAIEKDKAKKEAEAELEIKDKEKKDWFEPEGQLTVDVYQTDGSIVIQSAIAGVKPEDLDISIENDVVLIRGKREKVVKEEKKDYFYQECYWGRFSREIILPAEVDASKTEAAIKDGILTIRIPKLNAGKQKKITIQK